MNLQELIDERINGLDKLYDELLTKREELNTKGEELEKLEIFKSLKNNSVKSLYLCGERDIII